MSHTVTARVTHAHDSKPVTTMSPILKQTGVHVSCCASRFRLLFIGSAHERDIAGNIGNYGFEERRDRSNS